MHVGWPQGTYLLAAVLTLCGAALKHGKTKTINFGEYFLSEVLVLALLYWGGFFK